MRSLKCYTSQDFVLTGSLNIALYRSDVPMVVFAELDHSRTNRHAMSCGTPLLGNSLLATAGGGATPVRRRGGTFTLVLRNGITVSAVYPSMTAAYMAVGQGFPGGVPPMQHGRHHGANAAPHARGVPTYSTQTEART